MQPGDTITVGHNDALKYNYADCVGEQVTVVDVGAGAIPVLIQTEEGFRFISMRDAVHEAPDSSDSFAK